MTPALPAAAEIRPPSPLLEEHLREARRLARGGLLLLALGFVPALAWLASAPLASAVVAQALVKVDLDRRPVQHAEGGIVREVRVRDGQHVREGEALIVLGDVAVNADVNRLTYRVLAERMGIARLEAEQAAAPAIDFAKDLVDAAQGDARLAEQQAKERALFAARRETLQEQLALLRAQRGNVLREIGSLAAQITNAEISVRHQRLELERNRQLLKDGFIAETRIAQLEANVADYGVKLEERRSDRARGEQRLVDIDLRARSLTSDYRQQASDQLKAASLRLSELQQELRKSIDASQRQVIVAPVAGEVINLRHTAPGGVVSPRESVADIVPADPRLVVEAQVRPEDISRVRQGQLANIRFGAFNQLTTPKVEGHVFYVAADRSVPREANQQAHYVVLVEADPESLRRAGNLALQAGMPAEVFIEGESRTALQYLVEPVTMVMRRAGRER